MVVIQLLSHVAMLPKILFEARVFVVPIFSRAVAWIQEENEFFYWQLLY